MAGKFLQIWSLRSVAKSLAVLIIITIAVKIYATREMPEGFEDDKEWEFWRDLDFAVCVVSLAFASVLLYGSITEFRMFILAWMTWNVIETAFWIVFLARKYNELVRWERTFRIVAIFLMVFAEIPVLNYFRFLRVRLEDPESNCPWTATQSDKEYKTLSERSSLASVNSVFSGRNKPGDNLGFRSDSVISVASEVEEISEKEEQKEKVEKKNKEGNDEKHDGTDAQSQTSFEISVTVHSAVKPADDNDNALQANVSTEIQNSEMVPEVPLPTIEDAQGISNNTEDQSVQTTVKKSDGINSETRENQTASSTVINEDSEAVNVESSPADSNVVAETTVKDVTIKSTHVDPTVAI